MGLEPCAPAHTLLGPLLSLPPVHLQLEPASESPEGLVKAAGGAPPILGAPDSEGLEQSPGTRVSSKSQVVLMPLAWGPRSGDRRSMPRVPGGPASCFTLALLPAVRKPVTLRCAVQRHQKSGGRGGKRKPLRLFLLSCLSF